MNLLVYCMQQRECILNTLDRAEGALNWDHFLHFFFGEKNFKRWNPFKRRIPIYISIKYRSTLFYICVFTFLYLCFYFFISVFLPFFISVFLLFYICVFTFLYLCFYFVLKYFILIYMLCCDWQTLAHVIL